MTLDRVSTPGRVAEDAEGITLDELALAARNHAMPLEALHYDVTPVGLHYLLTHYDIPFAQADAWPVSVHGSVARPLTLGLAGLRRRPSTTVRVTMECAGNGRARLSPRPISQPWLVEAVGTADWTGVPLRDLLEEAEVDRSVVDVVFTGADHGVERGVEQDYQRALPLGDATRPEVILAYEMNGSPLPPQHGFPVRLVVPGWYGMAHVKWLRSIELVDAPFDGFQHHAYRRRTTPDDPGIPVTRIEPRALLIPPGFPDFMTRARIVDAGDVTLTGRAWAGHAPIESVEVSLDGGERWQPARLEADTGHRWAWRRFEFNWRSTPGTYRLTARARDTEGRRQPVVQAWNRGGFANNAVQLIPTLCR